MGILWFGGSIYTLENAREAVEAVYTENDEIKAVGTYEKLYHEHYKNIDKEMNLQGKTMLPGLVDSHLHIIMHGEKLLRLDLSQMKSAEEVKEALRNRMANLAEGEWLVGEGWNENQWDDPSIIHKSELDEICPDNPMMLTRVCRHAILTNSKAMQLANLNKQTPNPQGGIIVRDEQGDTTGYLLDTAQEIIKQAMPGVSQNYLEQVIKIAVDDLISKGLVGGHSEDLNYYGGFLKTYNAFKNALNDDNKKFKAHLLVHHEVMEDMVNEKLGYLDGTANVELGAVKIFSDGALGGRTAWLTESYSDDIGNKGVAIHSQNSLEQLVRDARQYGLPIAVHAIGDKAVDEITNIIKKYPLTNGARDRIIHGQILNKQSLQMLQKLPVVVDIQPSFVTSDFPWVIDRIGESRIPLAYAWKTMLNNKVHCAGGSDAPIEEVSPLLGIQAAVERKSSIDGKVYNEAERLSIYEAIQLYTSGSAYAVKQEHERGLIAKGFKADFTILEEDVFKVETDKIHEIDVAITVIDGDIVYEKNPSQS
ncbi:amidohydrolase [Virgibacillus profundi]|uniref:Amidohydrolase n=1 Tax=Virgibacillus profundi TaxID=2024555 RepID=A0A2A2IFX9_9BACI|nr:amidohydrolase [Virgibacillus profundi]PAV30144.1 amidohydrolase [Virgibacillus profundi]PXY54316.1 amidohydrolase [Virgibacillus profundi]